jgi:RNA polymerase sigma-70 factor (ECF subfamily)
MNVDASDKHVDDGSSASIRIDQWISEFRDSLRMMLELRMDARLRTRIDPSDVLQETFIEAANRLDDFHNSGMKPRLWLRYLAQQQLLIAWRRHAKTKSRDVHREARIDSLSVSGEALVNMILQSGTTPSQLLIKEESLFRMRNAMEQLDEIDREVLTMRHYEQLSLDETAEVLKISTAAASKRYYRALKRIASLLGNE